MIPNDPSFLEFYTLKFLRENDRIYQEFFYIVKEKILTVASGRAWTTQFSSTSICSPSRWYQFCSISISGGSVIGRLRSWFNVVYRNRYKVGWISNEVGFFLILQKKLGQKGLTQWAKTRTMHFFPQRLAKINVF